MGELGGHQIKILELGLWIHICRYTCVGQQINVLEVVLCRPCPQWKQG